MSSTARAREADFDARAIARAVEAWFRKHARDLPWRRDRSGYTALVSEAMLQQTQVSRVIEKYEAFMRRFPTVDDLARADEQAVLAMWQGLGYYRRARHLHTAAKAIVDEFNGSVPSRARDLQKLPGIGKYTAGAIASIIFNERTPIVDGNVQRVLARVAADDRAPQDRNAVEDCWRLAEQLVRASDDPAACNEGLMELGAMICTPGQPDCPRCPLASMCLARRTGRERTIPPAKPPARQQSVVHHAVLFARGGRVLIEQRPATGLWSNMWQVPTIEATSPLDERELRAQLSVPVTTIEFIEAFAHQTTHRRITFRLHRGITRARKGRWVALNEIDAYPMSNPQRRIIQQIEPPTDRRATRSTATGGGAQATRSR